MSNLKRNNEFQVVPQLLEVFVNGVFDWAKQTHTIKSSSFGLSNAKSCHSCGLSIFPLGYSKHQKISRPPPLSQTPTPSHTFKLPKKNSNNYSGPIAHHSTHSCSPSLSSPLPTTTTTNILPTTLALLAVPLSTTTTIPTIIIIITPFNITISPIPHN